MRVLIGCEESGVVRRAFRGYGHEAYSCDLLPARDHMQTGPEPYHLQLDVSDAINICGPWDLIILHPPCTYIAVSGNRWYANTEKRRKAMEWTQQLWDLATAVCPRVCLENPVGLKLLNSSKPQWVQPWEFGHPTTKKTGLWLHGLPPLEPTDVVTPTEQRVWKMPPSATRARDRSQTYLGIGEAMASQWGSNVEQDTYKEISESVNA